MSKLDNIILECANKVLDGKQETFGDYIDPTKRQIKDLMLELIGETSSIYQNDEETIELRDKVNAL